MEKQIFAALEIVDHEIRLVLGEFFNTRFNVLKVERVACSGVENFTVINREKVISTLKKTLEDASEKLGATIEQVLLCIPSLNARRISMKVTVPVESIDRKVTVLDVRKALRKAMNTRLDSSLALINAVCVRYTCNGITTRRIPLQEVCDQLTVQVDLLCADKALTFDIVSCVEECGCKVMDVGLDCYAIAKEACLFEQTVDQNVIVLKLEEKSTTMALLYDGKLISSEILESGYGQWAKNVSLKYRLPMDIAVRLCKYNLQLEESLLSDSPVYIWSRNQVTSTLSSRQIADEVRVSVLDWAKKIETICHGIIDSRTTTIVLTGEGAEIQALQTILKEQLGIKVRRYVPETLGARNPALSSCLGMFYAFKDQSNILGESCSGINLEEFEKSIKLKRAEKTVQQESHEYTITGKLKSILFDSKE